MEFFVDVHLVLIAIIYATRDVGVVLTRQRSFTVYRVWIFVFYCGVENLWAVTISWTRVRESNRTQREATWPTPATNSTARFEVSQSNSRCDDNPFTHYIVCVVVNEFYYKSFPTFVVGLQKIFIHSLIQATNFVNCTALAVKGGAIVTLLECLWRKFANWCINLLVRRRKPTRPNWWRMMPAPLPSCGVRLFVCPSVVFVNSVKTNEDNLLNFFTVG